MSYDSDKTPIDKLIEPPKIKELQKSIKIHEKNIGLMKGKIDKLKIKRKEIVYGTRFTPLKI